VSVLKREAELLQQLLQDPDADTEAIRNLADSLAGAIANAPEWPTPEQSLALGRLLADRQANVMRAFNGASMFLPADYVGADFREPGTNEPYFECGIAPDGRVSS
jgi:hypothetical protein